MEQKDRQQMRNLMHHLRKMREISAPSSLIPTVQMRLEQEQHVFKETTNTPAPADRLIPFSFGIFADNSINTANRLLEQLDDLITSTIQKMIVGTAPHPEFHQLEIDDLTQTVRIKFWRALQSQQITHSGLPGMEMTDLVQDARIRLWRTFQREDTTSPNALIARIAHSVVVDTIRRYKPVQWLSTDADGELHEGHPLMTTGEGMHDPAYELEQKEIDADWVKNVIHAIHRLPPCQRYAIICLLNEQLDSIHPVFVAMFQASGIDIKAARWPKDAAERRSLRTSLAIARKKLRSLLSQP